MLLHEHSVLVNQTSPILKLSFSFLSELHICKVLSKQMWAVQTSLARGNNRLWKLLNAPKAPVLFFVFFHRWTASMVAGGVLKSLSYSQARMERGSALCKLFFRRCHSYLLDSVLPDDIHYVSSAGSWWEQATKGPVWFSLVSQK